MKNQNCHEFWMLAESLRINDIVALWCDQEPTEFNNFIQQSGYSPSCADAKRASLEDALLKGDLDYIDEGIPYNGNKLWDGGEVSELIKKNRLRIEKAKLRKWFDLKYTSGQLREIPTFLDEEKQQAQLLQKQRNNLESQQQTDYEQKIADLESQLEQAKTDLADISIDDSEQLNARTEKSYQTTIGLLLELMISPKGFDGKKPFPSQAIIISEIVEQSIYGQGKSTLESRFSNANDVLSDVKKK